MKRIATGLAAGALVMLSLVPCVNAQSWEDIQSDRGAIEAGHKDLGYDRDELREDLRRGDYGSAAREQAEISARRERLHEKQEDLNNDMAPRFYSDCGYGNTWQDYNGDEDDD
jgi:hypothetical protein